MDRELIHSNRFIRQYRIRGPDGQKAFKTEKTALGWAVFVWPWLYPWVAVLAFEVVIRVLKW